MPRPRVAVKLDMRGVDATAAMVERVGENAYRQEATLYGIGVQVAASITRVPVDTGRLSESFKVLKNSAHFFIVGSDVPYSRYVREGTSHNKAKPFRVPPFARRASEILSRSIVQ
jgi:hypothetical protein